MSEEDTRRSSEESGGEEEKVTPAEVENVTAVIVPPLPAPEVTNPVSDPNSPKGSSNKKAKPTKRVQLQLPAKNKMEKEANGTVDSTKKEEEEEEEEEVEEEEVAAPTLDLSKILDSCLAVVSFFGMVLRKCLCFVRDTLLRVFRALQCVLPGSLALGVFVLISYLLATYVVDQGPTVIIFSDRMDYVLKKMSLVLLPTVLGLLGQRLGSAHVLHKKLTAQSLDDSVLLCLNALVLATHINEDCLNCIHVLFIVTTIYRLCGWLGQLYNINSSVQYFLTVPVQIVHIVLGLYNVYSMLGRDLGLFDAGTVNAATQTVREEVEQLGEAEWEYPDFCGVMEKMFCQVKGAPRRLYNKL